MITKLSDIAQPEQAEAELAEYRNHFESLVEKRTAELTAVNEQLRLHIAWLSAINQVNQMMVGSADFTKIYGKITEVINQLLNTQDSFIGELDAGKKQLKILAHSCRSDSHPVLTGSVTSLPGAFLSSPSIKQGDLTIYSKGQLNSLSGPASQHIRNTDIHTIVLVPLRLREEVLGFLGLEIHDQDWVLTPDERYLFNLISSDIAQVIENSHVYEQTRALIMAEERGRLARDLHDSVTQVLFSATLLAEVLPQIWRRDPELGLQRLDKLQRLTRGALAEMRTLLLELRPSAVINTPLGNLLGQLTEAITSRSELPFQLFIEQIPPLPENVQMNFYRIAQEALNNVVKHAQANRVIVSLSETLVPLNGSGLMGREVKLEIEDDGVGFFSGKGKTGQLGIGIMRERAAAIQASLSLESQLGYGTQMTLTWCGETGSLP